ncbi:hypothetical protein GCM10017566_00980 [Amycolatopsis bartoniae]|uniref:Uncharacterized protein n=1 Tax=Amycolatopsis bartoniae TaxID=941986 RepID=A0A8H9MB25_9PSEU|nr:hypothetical protein GCM10017566_00980 [Amycolatopsis bartoniae]
MRRRGEAGFLRFRDDGCYELKPKLILRDICRHLPLDRLPSRPIAIRIVFAEVAPPLHRPQRNRPRGTYLPRHQPARLTGTTW